MRATERAARAELRAIGVTPASSALGAAIVDLAKRLDERPGDRAASMLCRELRLSMAALWAKNKTGIDHDLDRFLASVATPAFSGPGD
jgi:hypothetical protein